MDVHELNAKLESKRDKLISIDKPKENRVYLVCESQNSFDICKFLYEDLKCRFAIATAIDSDNYFEILYHFTYDELGYVITVKSLIRDKKNPSTESISTFLPAAQWIEREMHDVAGIEFKNHPNMKRLILSDDWPDGVYPLRKENKK